MQIQNQKGKSSEELIQEAKSAEGKLIAIFVPLICAAIQEENPEFKLSQIQNAVVRRCGAAGLPWSREYIRHYWGEFARSYEKTGKYKGVAADFKLDLKNQISKTFNKIPEQKLVEPPKEKYTFVETEEEEDFEKDLHSYGMGKIGDSGKSVREVLGDVNEYCAGLFKALSGKDIPHATENMDLIVDYIKPTREYWKTYMEEADDRERRRTWNWLSAVVEMAEDRLELLKKIK